MKSSHVDGVLCIKQVELKESARAFLSQGHGKLSVIMRYLYQVSVRKACLTVHTTINLHFLIKNGGACKASKNLTPRIDWCRAVLHSSSSFTQLTFAPDKNIENAK